MSPLFWKRNCGAGARAREISRKQRESPQRRVFAARLNTWRRASCRDRRSRQRSRSLSCLRLSFGIAQDQDRAARVTGRQDSGSPPKVGSPPMRRARSRRGARPPARKLFVGLSKLSVNFSNPFAKLFQTFLSRSCNTQAALVLRSRAKRGVSKDAPAGANEAASWTLFRDAMLRIAPQDEAVGLAPALPGSAWE